jgi:two-component system sensor kinase FixL
MLDGDDDRVDIARLRQAIQRASEQASRAGEIIRRLRAFILRGEADMRAEPLTSLVREAAALALFNSSSFGIRLSYDFENEGRVVLGDRIQIQQVLVNLIRNAADAMTAQGEGRRELLISTKMARDNLIEIAVQDSGPGIAPEMLEKLFSPFATTKREGLGFGLAISRRIIEAHGGQMSAAAARDGGAVFRFTLPVMEEEAAR